MKQMFRGFAFLAGFVVMAAAVAKGADPGPQTVAIFPAEMKHNHSSCVVELANGDLLACWYRGSGERKADDVAIWAARRDAKTGQWGPRFPLADTPGYPDCNPALFVDPAGRVWLFYPTIIDHNWSGALLKYGVTPGDVNADHPVRWEERGVIHVTPEGFGPAMDAAVETLPAPVKLILKTKFAEVETRSHDELYQRLGWMPRVHLTTLPSGRWLLPLYTDTFSCSLVLRSDDQGETWQASTPIIGWGNIQPSIVRRDDGTLVAYMRDNGPFGFIRESSSSDQGETWGPVSNSPLPNPGAGVEAIRLASGRWVMVYNDTTKGRHSLALSLSEDEGRTWTRTRHLAKAEPEARSFHYPSILQARDGAIHVTYTHGNQPGGSTIDHGVVTEDWLLEAESEPTGSESP